MVTHADAENIKETLSDIETQLTYIRSSLDTLIATLAWVGLASIHTDLDFTDKQDIAKKLKAIIDDYS